ncbi:glutamate-5-semialdehyde dehydrogenase [soil metagenome]
MAAEPVIRAESTTVRDVCAAAKEASRALARADAQTRNAALHAVAAALSERSAAIVAANERDVEAATEAGLSAALIDRLKLTPDRVAGIAFDVLSIAALPDPVGEVIEGRRLDNGLDLRKVRVPLGVVAVVYEARPNVTIDCTAQSLKSGNAIVLRGSSMAGGSNAILAEIARDAVASVGLPPASVSLVAGGGREELPELVTQSEFLDLVIPRGGEGLKAVLAEHATVPVVYAASGNCHVFVDASADLSDAVAIAVNAKVQRPGVCNAAETLLVHSEAAAEFLPQAMRELRESGVELRADGRARVAAGELGDTVAEATEEDWATEYLALVLAVRVVDSLHEAIEHVNEHGSGHSEAIVTRDVTSARAFERGVDAACVYVNASTRFTDGGEFGMGAEIGNSTQKLHARGPIGVRELCTFKYVVLGDGHVRP